MTQFPEPYEILFKKAQSDIALAQRGFNAHDDLIDEATLLFHLQ